MTVMQSRLTVNKPRHAAPKVQSLPQPPDEREKYAYMGKRSNRWVLAGSMAAVGYLGVNLMRVALGRLVTLPLAIVAVILLLVPVVGALTALRGRRFSRVEHDRMVADFDRPRPHVAVFLPSAGEDLAILNNTFLHVSALDWDGEVSVYVLDDSARDEVHELSKRYGFLYFTRPNRGYMKKAGNLLFGYELLTDEEYILVLDADFVPRPDMLDELVPYFYQKESKIGIVQSPQFFDTGKSMNWLQSGAGATQEFFYRWVQPARDKLGSPICVGTCAVYSVQALRDAGGFAQIEHSEDVHTGVKLRKAGYDTRFVPINLSKGLCPDDLRGFINQQYRWCAGSMSLLRDAKFHQIKMPLKSKLCFWSGFIYYITTALLVFGSPVTSVIMLWNHPTVIYPHRFLTYLPILIFSWVLIPKVMHARWGIEIYRVQYIYSMAHAMAIFDTFLLGKTAAWVPTGAVKKGNSLDKKVKRLMVFWIVFTTISFWSGVTHMALLFGIVSVWPLLLLGLLQLLIQVPILLPLSSPYKRRDKVRSLSLLPRRVIVAGALALALTGCGASYHPVPKVAEASSQARVHAPGDPASFVMTFNGPAGQKASSKFFNYEQGGKGWGGKQVQTYTDRATNASLDGNGHLIITARRETYKGVDGIVRNWTSARLSTQNKFAYTYGTLSVTAKIPAGQGLWPALWQLGSNINAVHWPASGEIDFMEAIDSATHLTTCAHWTGNFNKNCTRPTMKPSYAAAFHTYSVTREPDFIEIDVDGTPINIIHRKPGQSWPFNAPFFLVMNVALGGPYPGNPTASTPSANPMIISSISYVR